MTQKMDLNQIDYDKKYYPRYKGTSDWMIVHRYAEALQTEPTKEFPPVVIVRATSFKVPYMLIDGVHRLHAYLKVGRQKIPVEIERIPRSKWLARSVELNSTHGRSLDSLDKASIATRLKEEGWEIRDVAKLLHMRVESLEKIVVERCVKLRVEDTQLITASGACHKIGNDHYGFLKAPLKGVSSRKEILEALQTQHSVTSHDVLAILDSMICVLRSGVVDMEDEEISSCVKEIHQLLLEII